MDGVIVEFRLAVLFSIASCRKIATLAIKGLIYQKIIFIIYIRKYFVFTLHACCVWSIIFSCFPVLSCEIYGIPWDLTGTHTVQGQSVTICCCGAELAFELIVWYQRASVTCSCCTTQVSLIHHHLLVSKTRTKWTSHSFRSSFESFELMIALDEWGLQFMLCVIAGTDCCSCCPVLHFCDLVELLVQPVVVTSSSGDEPICLSEQRET